MPLFRKSKEEGLKPLSEKDIQERLYGFFHQERPIHTSIPTKRTISKSVDLRSVEVTPAGIIQSDLFRSENAALSNPDVSEQETDNIPTSRELPETIRRNENVKGFEQKFTSPSRRNGSDFQADENSQENEETSVLNPAVKKPVRKTVRKSAKKDKKNFEEAKKFFGMIASGLISFLSVFISWLSRGFSALVLWLSESRGESRRIPAKFVLISLAVIGTGLIVFNLWSAHLKQGVAVPVTSTIIPEYSDVKKVQTKNQPITKLVAVNSDVISRPETSETQALAPAKKFFSIQVCVSQSQEGAVGIVKKLKAGGLPAFYDPGTSKRGGKIYKIMLGKFETYPTAKTQLEVFKKAKAMEPYQDSFIRNLTTQR